MSKQLESILKRMPAATPAAPLRVVPEVSAPAAQSDAVREAGASVAEQSRPSKKAQPKKVEAKAVEDQAPVAEPERAIQAYVPISVAKALNMRAAAEDVTVRTLILQGLKAIGFEISDSQVRDRRK
jgi:hypothetical protein